jgi:hypothetical protein
MDDYRWWLVFVGFAMACLYGAIGYADHNRAMVRAECLKAGHPALECKEL